MQSPLQLRFFRSKTELDAVVHNFPEDEDVVLDLWTREDIVHNFPEDEDVVLDLRG